MNLTNACLYMYIVYIQGQLGLAQVLSQWTASCPASLGTLAEIEAINKTKASYQLNILSLGNFKLLKAALSQYSVLLNVLVYGIIDEYIMY